MRTLAAITAIAIIPGVVVGAFFTDRQALRSPEDDDDDNSGDYWGW